MLILLDHVCQLLFGALNRNPLLASWMLVEKMVAMHLPASRCDMVLLQTSVYVYHSVCGLSGMDAVLMVENIIIAMVNWQGVVHCVRWSTNNWHFSM